MRNLIAHIGLLLVAMWISLAWSSAPVEEQAQKISAEKNVKLTTNMGNIVIELYSDTAPITVANFLGYVKNGHYVGTIFHRVIPGFMAQGGGFDTDLNQKPTLPPIQNEADNGLKNKRGTIAMARTNDPHSATTQFFINLVDNDFLDHNEKSIRGWGYAVFGKVVEGMDTVDKIAEVPTGAMVPFASDVPRETIKITAAEAW
ncbi:MAG TPA: hypothetical protein DCZ13_09750 [Porticoccaceae bacterium]|nr:hypothetical protein [Porticoccaceae bacterium]